MNYSSRNDYDFIQYFKKYNLLYDDLLCMLKWKKFLRRDKIIIYPL